ncbi:MAG TPA: hypothetical protein VKP30_34180, partial [Polyangiaceae bacterium]|nr:hypothetical protein [Polyangiaceae bacterium]
MSQAGVPPGQGNPPGYGRPPSPATPQEPAGAGGQKGGTLPMSAVPDLAGYAPNQSAPANYGVPPNQSAPANYGAGQNYVAPANQGAAQNYAYSPGPVAPVQNQVAPGYPIAPQGYAPDPRANRAAPAGGPPAAAHAKPSSVVLMLVLGVIGMIVLITAGAGAYWYRQRAVSLERQLAEAAAARNNVTRSEALEGDCKKAYACCVAIASK